MTTTTTPPAPRDPEAILAAAAEAQHAFWDALSELETAIDCDIDGSFNLEEWSIDELRKNYKR